MAEVCKLLDIEKTKTSLMGRWSAIIARKSKCSEVNKEDWDLQLQTCMMAYRSSVHESTGETPNVDARPGDRGAFGRDY